MSVREAQLKMPHGWSLTGMQGTPPQRDNASVCLDPATNCLYMFGGLDAKGVPTNTLYKLDLHAMPQSNWEEVVCKGAPTARWGHSTFVASSKLFIYGGADPKQRSDMFQLDLNTKAWSKPAQLGSKPDRNFSSREQSFQKAVSLSKDTLLAFGRDHQENVDPRRPAEALGLQLHTYDIASGVWSHMHTRGYIPFDHLEGLVAADDKLLCVGWSWPPAGVKGPSHMQVCMLDLEHISHPIAARPTSPLPRKTPTAFSPPVTRSLRSRTTPCWTILPCKAAPTARVGCAAAVLKGHLVLQGGLHCSGGAKGQLTADAFCLDLASMTWTQIGKDSMLRSSHNIARVNHVTVAVESANAIVVLGGTCSRQQHASCTTMNCIRLRQATVPAPPTAAASIPTPAATAATNAAVFATEVCASSQPGRIRAATQRPGRSAPAAIPAGYAAKPPITLATAAASAPPAMSVMFAPAATQQHETTRTPDSARQPEAAGEQGMTPPLTSTRARSPARRSDHPVLAGPGAATRALAALSGSSAAAPQAAFARGFVPVYDFSAYCCQGPLSDVDLVVGGETFPAHRLVLCVSDKLRDLLSKADSSQQRLPGGVECRWRLELQDVYPDVLKMMLQYMYGCLTDISVDAAPLLFKASDRYGLPGLRAACLAVLVSSTCLENVTSYALLAHDHNCQELAQACVSFTAASSQRFLQVLSTPGYLHLNQINAKAGQEFTQAAMEHMTGKK